MEFSPHIHMPREGWEKWGKSILPIRHTCTSFIVIIVWKEGWCSRSIWQKSRKRPRKNVGFRRCLVWRFTGGIDSFGETFRSAENNIPKGKDVQSAPYNATKKEIPPLLLQSITDSKSDVDEVLMCDTPKRQDSNATERRRHKTMGITKKTYCFGNFIHGSIVHSKFRNHVDALSNCLNMRKFSEKIWN